jgi:hypothetical protein
MPGQSINAGLDVRIESQEPGLGTQKAKIISYSKPILWKF